MGGGRRPTQLNAQTRVSTTGFGGRKARDYVAAQAPTDTGLYNFWRLILHTPCRIVLMVTGMLGRFLGQHFHRLATCDLSKMLAADLPSPRLD